MLLRRSSWIRARRAAAALAFCCVTWPAVTVVGQVGDDFDIDNITNAPPPDAATTTASDPSDLADPAVPPGGPAGEGGEPTISGDEIFASAERLRESGNWPEAIREYGKILSREPRHVPSAIGAAQCYDALEEYESAIELLSNSIQYVPSSVELLQQRGNTYLSANQFDKALEDFTTAAKLDPVNPQLLFLRGKAQLRVGQSLLQEQDPDASIAIGQAVASLDKSIKYKDDVAEAYYERGTAYSIMRSTEAAVDDFRKAVQLDGENAKYKAQLGYGELTLGSDKSRRTSANKEEVIGHFRAALTAMDEFVAANPTGNKSEYRDKLRSSKPDDIPVTNVLLSQANARVELAKHVPDADRQLLYDQAVADCNKVLELDETSVGAYFQRAIVERLTGDFEKALGSLREASEVAGESPELMLRRGIIYYHQGQLSMARTDFVKALERSPQPDPRAAFWAGVAEARLGNMLEAIRRYSTAIRENPSYLPALNNRGLAYMELGDYQRAVDDFDRILALRGDNPTIRARRDQAASRVTLGN